MRPRMAARSRLLFLPPLVLVTALLPPLRALSAPQEQDSPARTAQNPSMEEINPHAVGLLGPEDIPKGPFHREASPSPLRWEPKQTSEFRWGNEKGSVWVLTLEEARTGTVLSDPPRPIMASRLRIGRKGRHGEEPLAFLQHVTNTEVVLLPPADPRLSDLGPALDDSLHPWPNDCFLSLVETPRPLDLNENGRYELAVRRFAPVAEPGGNGIVLVEPDAKGNPKILPLSDLVEIVRFDGGNLVDITWPAKESKPVIEAEFPPLYRCRFLNQLEIRGESGCVNCCEIRVILRNVRKGLYRPSYVRDLHYPFFEAMQGDLADIENGDPDVPLRPVEEATLCRAAAFMYLTGTGSGTRLQLEKLLGRRTRLVSVQLLLARLDRYFLRDQG